MRQTNIHMRGTLPDRGTRRVRARSRASAREGADIDGPEWQTERWKHVVEAEARQRLKGEIRDVGSKA